MVRRREVHVPEDTRTYKHDRDDGDDGYGSHPFSDHGSCQAEMKFKESGASIYSRASTPSPTAGDPFAPWAG